MGSKMQTKAESIFKKSNVISTNYFTTFLQNIGVTNFLLVFI